MEVRASRSSGRTDVPDELSSLDGLSRHDGEGREMRVVSRDAIAVIDNDEVTRMLTVDAAWVERRTGIQTRRWAAPDAVLAARAWVVVCACGSSGSLAARPTTRTPWLWR